MFKLNDRIDNDTFEICDLSLCKVLLMNDSNYPWLLLVPRINDLTELHHMTPEQQVQVMNEISLVSEVLEEKYKPKSLNVAALGNVVAQLHIHVIVRYEDDQAWPKPVWGHIPAKPYPGDEVTKLAKELKNTFESLQK